MKYIKVFDPWGNSLCKCPPKYSFNPYTGCRFGCRYCYITSYIRDGFNPRPKQIDFYTLERDVLKVSKTGRPIALALSTDVYQPLEKVYEYTRRILKLLMKYGVPTLITTKSPMILKDIDILRNMNVAVSVTITTLNREKASILEPYAPRPESRLRLVKRLSDEGIPVTVRIDPIIPSITDDINEIGEAIRRYRHAGAKHIVASVYKSKPDNLKRLVRAYPDFIKTYGEIYGGGPRINGYRYADKNYSFRILSQVKHLAVKNDLTFNTCRDGLEFLDSKGTFCDASHLLNYSQNI